MKLFVVTCDIQSNLFVKAQKRQTLHIVQLLNDEIEFREIITINIVQHHYRIEIWFKNETNQIRTFIYSFFYIFMFYILSLSELLI